MGGNYRKIICKPHGVFFKIKRYTDPTQPLVWTNLMDFNNVPLECIAAKVSGGDGGTKGGGAEGSDTTEQAEKLEGGDTFKPSSS